MPSINIYFSDEVYEKLRNKGNKSGYVNDVILKDLTNEVKQLSFEELERKKQDIKIEEEALKRIFNEQKELEEVSKLKKESQIERYKQTAKEYFDLDLDNNTIIKIIESNLSIPEYCEKFLGWSYNGSKNN